MLKEVGLEGTLERGESGPLTQGEREGCSRWMGHRQKKSGGQRWRVWSEGCVGRAKRARGSIEVERLREVAGCRVVERLLAEG